MQLTKICFAIDNDNDWHTVAKFMRMVDTHKATGHLRTAPVQCIGSYKGQLENSYIMDKVEFDKLVKDSGYVDNQETFLEIPGDTRQPCTLLVSEGGSYNVGAMRRVTKAEALSRVSWTYVPSTNQYFTTEKEV